MDSWIVFIVPLVDSKIQLETRIVMTAPLALTNRLSDPPPAFPAS
jgi:hypothetical protein